MATHLNPSLVGAFTRERLRADILNRGEDSFQHDLQEITEALQADRRHALETARRLQLGALLLMQGEAARLSAFAPRDVRVAALREGAARALEQSELLGDEAAVAAVRVPRVRVTEALLHGRVTDDASRPAGPLTVTLVDAQGKPVEGVEPVEADSAGYYALVVPAEVASTLPEEGRYTVSLGHGEDRVAPHLEPQPIAAGVVQLKDVALSDAELKKLKLRLEFPEFRPRAPAPAKGAAPRKGGRHGDAPGDEAQ